MGRTLSNCFQGNGAFYGTVTQSDKWFKVRYEDGDEEDLTRKELLRLPKRGIAEMSTPVRWLHI